MQQLLRVARRAVRAAASLRGGNGAVAVVVHASGAPRCAGMASGGAASSGRAAPAHGHGRPMQPLNRPARVAAPLVAVVDVPLRGPRGAAVAAAAATSNRGGSAGPRSSSGVSSRPARAPARQQQQAEAEEDTGPTFQDLGMGPPLLAALEAMGIAKPTEVQVCGGVRGASGGGAAGVGEGVGCHGARRWGLHVRSRARMGMGSTCPP